MATESVSRPLNSDRNKTDGRLNTVTAAALFGGAVAATAGAYFGTRALARRNREKDGRPINSVMAAAITACDLAHEKNETEPSTIAEPAVPTEPRV